MIGFGLAQDARNNSIEQAPAISDQAHREIESLLTDQQEQLAKAMEQRMHAGEESRRPASPED
jgi:F0F1-type ATP synthase membrane subunit b/b'